MKILILTLMMTLEDHYSLYRYTVFHFGIQTIKIGIYLLFFYCMFRCFTVVGRRQCVPVCCRHFGTAPTLQYGYSIVYYHH